MKYFILYLFLIFKAHFNIFVITNKISLPYEKLLQPQKSRRSLNLLDN